MPAPEAEAAIANFCRAYRRRAVLVFAARLRRNDPRQRARRRKYWAEQFARHGFVRDVDFDASFITPWAVRFRRNSEPMHRVVAGYERQHAPLVRERADLRARLAAMEAELKRTQQELIAAQSAIAERRDTIAHMEQSAFWKLRQS